MSTIIIGVDLAKSVFSLCEVDSYGHVRVDNINSTRSVTGMQSDNRCSTQSTDTQHAARRTTP